MSAFTKSNLDVNMQAAVASEVNKRMSNAIDDLKEKYASNIPSLITFASGPSRTADIEKTLVTGVHGPKEVYCFLIEG
jgi:L-lactate dehydrogenase complex protein LldG